METPSFLKDSLDFPSSLKDLIVIFPKAAWVCRCDPDLVSWLESDFKTTLQNQASLEQWAQWLESVVDRAMKPYENAGAQDFARAARQFLLKWSFYRSLSNIIIFIHFIRIFDSNFKVFIKVYRF